MYLRQNVNINCSDKDIIKYLKQLLKANIMQALINIF